MVGREAHGTERQSGLASGRHGYSQGDSPHPALLVVPDYWPDGSRRRIARMATIIITKCETFINLENARAYRKLLPVGFGSPLAAIAFPHFRHGNQIAGQLIYKSIACRRYPSSLQLLPSRKTRPNASYENGTGLTFGPRAN